MIVIVAGSRALLVLLIFRSTQNSNGRSQNSKDSSSMVLVYSQKVAPIQADVSGSQLEPLPESDFPDPRRILQIQQESIFNLTSHMRVQDYEARDMSRYKGCIENSKVGDKCSEGAAKILLQISKADGEKLQRIAHKALKSRYAVNSGHRYE
ncbi:hypothetical protein NHQ30_006771 [Ciborinia camelliae]|nr:hypothetical protein NHQ30_006771 [Ciborinia camelliae]